MQFTIKQSVFLKALHTVIGAIESRQTLAILSHVLLKVRNDNLTVVATDLEIELQAVAPLLSAPQELDELDITMPARKTYDILRTLPSEDDVFLKCDGKKITLSASGSRFTLASLEPTEFPRFDESAPAITELTLPSENIVTLCKKTSFAMAQQDVRYYLNGLFFCGNDKELSAAASNGHRLAVSSVLLEKPVEKMQLIMPRKSISEIIKLLDSEPKESVNVVLGTTYVKVVTVEFILISKLIEGKFPDFRQALPKNGNKTVIIEHGVLRSLLNRAIVLANEKLYGVRCCLEANKMTLQANNPEQEQVEVALDIEYSGGALEICFNAKYMLDILNIISDEPVKLTLSTENSPILVESTSDPNSLYVVMPMRL